MKTELNKVCTIKDTEINLFREMSKILSSRYHVSFVEETHMQYVTYQSSSVKHLAQREISDLWIIAFSPSTGSVRMTFLQAKYYRGVLNKMNTTFHGEYFQYELLSDRPLLTGVVAKRFNFPMDILSSVCGPSVGSFGVFYIDNSNEIDMAYCTANKLANKTGLPRTYANYPVDLEIPFHSPLKFDVCTKGSCSELISCFNIDEFTDNLLSQQIGAEITHNPNILYYVRSVLQRLTGAATGQLIDFIDALPTGGDTGNNRGDNDGDGLITNLLVINTDPIISDQ